MKKIGIYLAAVLMLSSCGKSEPKIEKPVDEDTSFSLSLGKMELPTSFKGDNLFLCSFSGEDANYEDSELVKNNTKWNFNSPIKLSDAPKVFCYSPLNALNFPYLEIDMRTQSPVYVSEPVQVDKKKPVADFRLKEMYSVLHLTIDDYRITGIEVKVPIMKYDMRDRSMNTGEEVSIIKFGDSILLPPLEVGELDSVKVSLFGKGERAFLMPIVDLKAGTEVTVNLHYQREFDIVTVKNVSVSNIQISPWKEGEHYNLKK